MKKSGSLISFLLISFLVVGSSLYAGEKYKVNSDKSSAHGSLDFRLHFLGKSYKFNPKKPFAGKFKGKIEQAGSVYEIIYTLKTKKNGNITGTEDTYLNGQVVLPLIVSGAVNSDGKTADITLAGADGSSPSEMGFTPSDNVRITLKGNGKKMVTMQYLDGSGTPFGDVVKYKRLSK